MNKRTSKVLRHGNHSLAVVLPKDWTRGMEIAAGEEIGIVYDGEVRIFKLPGAESNEEP